MKKPVTVIEFCENFLEPLQDIAIVDFESELVYYKGKPQWLIESQDNKLYQYLGACITRRISPYYALDDKLRIQIEI